MSQQDLLTVIVPTRERPDTLKHCLRTIVAQEDPRMEIIVSDNCSAPETKEVFDSFDDPRLRYVRPDHRLGMSEHWEFALSHAAGNWVTIIGDDDGLLPHAVTRLFKMVDGTDIKAVASLNCSFEWAHPEENKDGRLVLLSGQGTEIRDSKQWLQKALDTKASYKDLPYLYTGSFIHRDVIQAAKQNTSGKFFHSIIPDVYAGAAVCSLTNQYLFSWEPLAIGGTSFHSNGSQYMQKTTKQIAEMDFHKENQMKFHPSLGDGSVQSLPLLVYECVLQSTHLREKELDFDMAVQLAFSILHAPKAKTDDVTEYCRNIAKMNNLDFEDVLRQLKKQRLKQKLRKLSKKITTLLPNKSAPHKNTVTNDASLQNIYDASQRAAKELKIIH